MATILVEDAAKTSGMLTVLYLLYTAAQKIIVAKKQAALLASCKSLPNSPTHSGGSTPVSGVFPGQVGPLRTLILTLFLVFFSNELFFPLLGRLATVVRAVITLPHFPPHL